MVKQERMNVKVDAEIVRKGKVVAAAKQIPLADYISALLRPLIDDDLGSVAAALVEKQAGDNGRPAVACFEDEDGQAAEAVLAQGAGRAVSSP